MSLLVPLVTVLLACSSSDDGAIRRPDPTVERPKNVLMVSIDTTRRDHVDRYATDGQVRTPFLSGLLADGLALDDHLQCSSWTLASTSCTLEGRMNEDTGWMAKLAEAFAARVPDGRRTLAARLRDAGWQTMIVSSNGFLSFEWNNVQGYEIVDRPTTADTRALLDAGRDLLVANTADDPRPWLLHVHLVEAHPPYTPPDPYDDADQALPPSRWDLDDQAGQYDAGAQYPTMSPDDQALLRAHLEARYTGELRRQDDLLAAWWAAFDADGWLDDTLVIVWTDHGEQFFEHGHQAHAWGLGAEENDGVAGFWAKDLAPRAWDRPTHAVDLVPTALDLLGLPLDGDATLDGYVVGEAPDDRPLYGSVSGRLGPMVSVTRSGTKLSFGWDGAVSTWDRATDRTEAIDTFDPDAPLDPDTLALWDLLVPRIEAVAALTPEAALTWPAALPHP
ncbi:MAG: sulfatase-like hydrolase/transferase [Myxococcota bacterium]